MVPYMSLVYAFNSPLQQVVIHPCHQGQLQRWQPTENQQVCTHKQWPTYKNVCVCHCVRTYLHMSVCVCVCVHVCISRAKGVRDISKSTHLPYTLSFQLEEKARQSLRC